MPTRRRGDDDHVMTGSTVTGLSWNVVADLRQLMQFPFMVNALRAGTIVAVAAGALGWFMVLRRQSFAGHTLAIVSFPGAAGAILAGLSPISGYFAASAQQITARPVVSFALTIGLGLVTVWLGLTAAYFSVYPVGFFITTFGFAGYVLAGAWRAFLWTRRRPAAAVPA